ncbi:MAG TPA: efflux transporter outer membrane subunit [Chlamydiales bacterium]|nr:efflux transporter outer membrane subunit [Chlamydiales bacterium]
MRRILFLLVLSGCVRIPESQQAIPESSCGVSSAVQEAIRSGGFEAGEWVQQKWWEQFDDAVLSTLIDRGLQSSPSLLLAQERLKAAAQVALQKKAALYPELDLDTLDVWTHLSREGFLRAFAPTFPATINDFYIGLSFYYEFDFWGKNRDLFQSALGEIAASSAEMMQAELIMATSIAYTYFELQFLLRKKQLLEERKETHDSVIQIAVQRQERAIDTAFEPLAARADTLDIEAELKELCSDIDGHIHKLKALAGMQQDEHLDIRQSDPKPLRLALPETLGLDLIGRRPDLIALRRRLEAAAKQVDAAKTDFYPNINLRAVLGTESVLFSKLFKKENWNLAALPAIHLPIFTAGRIRAQLYEKLADFNGAVYSYNQLILEAAREVADSLTKINALLQEIEIRKQSLRVALSQETIAFRRYAGALATRSDRLSARDIVLQKQLILATIEYGTQLAEIELVRQLGGGFSDGE